MLDKSDITKQTPEKSLLEPKKRSGGRNSHGELTIWQFVDFLEDGCFE